MKITGATRAAFSPAVGRRLHPETIPGEHPHPYTEKQLRGFYGNLAALLAWRPEDYPAWAYIRTRNNIQEPSEKGLWLPPFNTLFLGMLQCGNLDDILKPGGTKPPTKALQLVMRWNFTPIADLSVPTLQEVNEAAPVPYGMRGVARCIGVIAAGQQGPELGMLDLQTNRYVVYPWPASVTANIPTATGAPVQA